MGDRKADHSGERLLDVADIEAGSLPFCLDAASKTKSILRTPFIMRTKKYRQDRSAPGDGEQ